MKAAQLIAPRQWQMIEVEKPRATNGKMLVRMERVAICGTDKPSFCGLYPSYPLEPGDTGHEGLGIVESCPSGSFQEGERVILWGFDRGLFQEYVLAPDVLAPEHGCIMLPGDFDLEVGLMSQLLGTVIHSFFKLGNVINQKVVVLGQGSVGQLFNATLRNLGAKYIIGVDPLIHKLEVASKMGATHTINPDERDVEEAVKEITGGEMADMVVEAIGRSITEVETLKIRDQTGGIWTFAGDAGFIGTSAAHLREHQLGGQSVLVTYVTRGDGLVAVDIRD